MAKQKFDGIVEAVHYAPDGRVDWVRAYERRGSTFSDYVLVARDDLVSKIKKGRRYLVGKRKKYLASTFDTSKEVRVATQDGGEVLVAGESQGKRDYLEGVPII